MNESRVPFSLALLASVALAGCFLCVCRVLSDRAGLYPLEASIALRVSTMTTSDVPTLASAESPHGREGSLAST